MTTAEIERAMARATQFQRQGQGRHAADIYRKVLKSDAKIAPAHYNLALLLKAEGKTSAADKSFKSALKYNPEYPIAWIAYGRFLSDRGRHRDAVRASMKAARLQGFSGAAVQEIADRVEAAGQEDLGKVGKEALGFCLGRADASSDGTILSVLGYLQRHPVLKKFLETGLRESEVDELLTDPKLLGDLLAALTEPFVASAMAFLILPLPELEQLFTCARRKLNQASFPAESLAALALQIDLTEYVLPSEGIKREVGQDNLSNALSDALFVPLECSRATTLLIDEADNLKNLPWARELLTRQGPQKNRELELSEKLGSLSASQDPVSQKVQAQYEESPYPRWRGLRSGGELALPVLLNSLFPFLSFPSISKRPKVLIAGCGTGRHALRTASRLTGADVMAIDLSRSSVAYGMRQTEELLIENLRFAQADIAALPKDLGVYDLIECCGVLHHMDDPEAAWSGLLRHLAPRGLMKIALYSEQARQDVVAVRDLVGEMLGSLNLEEMRELRQQLLSLPEDHPAAPVTQELDFYSLSGCRDFLFHQQEQRFDLARIESALSSLKLEFLGFEFTDPHVLRGYQQKFPSDSTSRNLDNWAALEQEVPSLFRGMYQFWCRPLS